MRFRPIVPCLALLVCMPGPLPPGVWAGSAGLRTEFGEEYEAYCARTSRLIPGLY